MHAVILAPGTSTRVPVLACADALRAESTIDRVEILSADSDADVDACLVGVHASQARLVVAGGDGVLRAVVRRMVRHALPPRDQPGTTPPSPQLPQSSPLPEHRTITDLAPVGLLPLDTPQKQPDLVHSLGLPTTPSDVAAVVAAGRVRRLDLFRNDHSRVTLHGALLGATTTGDRANGRLVAWRAHIGVDDTVLSNGDEAVLACSIANADGYATLGSLPLLPQVAADDGSIAVAIAVACPGANSGDIGVRDIEVRRTRGRAVRVTLSPPEGHNGGTDTPQSHVEYTDDGVDFTLRRSATWWVERGAWAVYTRG